MHKDRKVELLSDDHLTVKGSSHRKIAKKWLVRSGDETHLQSGTKTVLEAGAELTIKVGAGFIKLDPSGVTISGAKIKINSGGSPGSGSGARPLLPEQSLKVEKGVDVPGPVLRQPSMVSSLDKAQAWASGVCKVCEETRAQDHSGGADVG